MVSHDLMCSANVTDCLFRAVEDLQLRIQRQASSRRLNTIRVTSSFPERIVARARARRKRHHRPAFACQLTIVLQNDEVCRTTFTTTTPTRHSPFLSRGQNTSSRTFIFILDPHGTMDRSRQASPSLHHFTKRRCALRNSKGPHTGSRWFNSIRRFHLHKRPRCVSCYA